jgi:hypothetical protein
MRAKALLAGSLMILAVGLQGPAGQAAGSPALQRSLDVYRWMHEQAVARGQAGAASGSSGSPASAERQAVVGAQAISRDQLPSPGAAEPDTEQEPSIAVDPNDPNVVVAVFQEGRYPDIAAVDDGYATSQDGGRTWIRGNLPHLTQAVGGEFERASDPVVAFGPDGSVYVTTIALDVVADGRNAVTIQRSDDGGLTFGDPVLIRDDIDPNLFNDKEWIAVDTFPSSPHFGRIYVAWDQIQGFQQPPQISFSDDRGQTWSQMHAISNQTNALGTIPLVRPNGDVTVVYVDVFSLRIVAHTSHDGGVTFGPIVKVDDCLATDPPDQRDGGCIPTAAVDRVTGDLYAGWTDARFRSDGLDDAVVVRSTDGGAHWGPLVKVNPDPSGSGLEHMTTAIGALNHRIDVSYYVRRKVGTEFGLTVRERYSVSTDDGATFGGEVTIGPPLDLTWSADAGGFYFLGDYAGVASAPSAAHPVWCRSSRPLVPKPYHQTTWTATVTF